MTAVEKFYTKSQRAIAELGLEQYVLEIELNGFTVVPPEVTGVTPDQIARLTQLLLDKSEELVGCRFTVTDGPAEALDYGAYRGTLELQSGATPSQFQLMQLCTFDRAFRDLAVNPVAAALMRHILGGMARFSSHNCFIKWAGEGYGESLGLHCDQLPWGRALAANCNWALTEYTLANGAFACVPGSHLLDSAPVMPRAVKQAIPVECPSGSLIAFHGQLWHGAYPRTTPGLRVTISNYFRHATMQPQDDIPNHFPRQLADDCDDPKVFREFAGFGSPYQTQALPLPRAVSRTV
jgi:hypothetical protein